jgi:hypothetical protein
LQCAEEPFWADLSDSADYVGEARVDDTELGQRVGLVLDAMASYATDVRELAVEYEATYQSLLQACQVLTEVKHEREALAARVAALEAEQQWRDPATAQPGQLAVLDYRTDWNGSRYQDKASRSLLAEEDGWYLADRRYVGAASVLGWMPWPEPSMEAP